MLKEARSLIIFLAQHILSPSGTVNEQIKWEAIATARGICTLKERCTCGDCAPAIIHPDAAAAEDGDSGLGAMATVAIGAACSVQ